VASSWSAWLSAAVALAGCVHPAAFAQPDAIARHASELAASGHAQVEVEQGGTVSVRSDDPIVVTIPGDERSYAWGLIKTGTPDQTQELSIGNFVAGCGPDGEGAACMARRTRGSIRVGTQRKLDPSGLAMGLFGAAATVIGVVCLASCRQRSDWAYVGTGLGVLTMSFPLSTVF
jgi:hypothetical protein